MPQVPSTRWCPTPEQLMILEEMYRSGVRTPNASQIQQITAHLSYYGKIEGKNVFYWFQNHKARDRQKFRRRLTRHNQLLHLHHQQHQHPFHSLDDEASHPPPPAQFHHQSTPPPADHHFFHQGCFQDATQGMDLLCKLETGGRDEAPATSGAAYGYEWMAMTSMTASGSTVSPPCCRPPKTLDLFPTRSTGLRDECNTSKSSSCSTSTNI